MPTTADIVIIGPLPKRERIAVVSVFNRVGLSPADGNDRLGYMRATGGPASYFILVSQDVGYIWKHGSDSPKPFPMQPVVKRFLPNLRPNERLYGFQVEMLVTHWLFELVAGWRDSREDPEKTLASVGFLAAVQGASVHSGSRCLIVYVETNFLITLGLRQEQCEAADAILKLAQESRADLAIPSLAVLEAIYTVEGWQRRRKDLSDGIGRELSQLRRSSAVPPLIGTLEMTIGELTRVGGEQLQDLQSAIERVLSIGRVIDFTPATLSTAISAQRSLDLTAADSILYSTIVNDVHHQPANDPKCFLTTDDRFRSAIVAELKQLGCRCIRSFKDGLSFIEKSAE